MYKYINFSADVEMVQMLEACRVNWNFSPLKLGMFVTATIVVAFHKHKLLFDIAYSDNPVDSIDIMQVVYVVLIQFGAEFLSYVISLIISVHYQLPIFSAWHHKPKRMWFFLVSLIVSAALVNMAFFQTVPRIQDCKSMDICSCSYPLHVNECIST